MKLKLEMTQRDKKLLVFLSFFVIIVCFGYYGVRPALVDILDTSEKIEEDKQIKADNDMNLAELPLIIQENKGIRADIKSINDQYFKMMSSDEIDKYFTGMALDHGVYSYSLDISKPIDNFTLPPYKYSEKYEKDLEEKKKEAAEKKKSKDKDEEEDDVIDNTKDGIHKVEVTMKLGGEQSQLTEFVNYISTTKLKMRVTKYSYTTQRTVVTGGNGSYSVVDSPILNITVEMYMCEEKE